MTVGALEDTVWFDEAGGVMYTWDTHFTWDVGHVWDGEETIWYDEEDD